MPATLVQSRSGTGSTATVTVTWTTPATAGNLLILTYQGDDYITAGGNPSGWTLPTGGDQRTFLGHALWYKVAAGGETSTAYTIGSASPTCWEFAELSGTATTSPLDVSNGAFAQSAGTSYTTPAVTPTAGDRLAIGSIGGSLSTAALSGVDTWINGYTEIVDAFTTLASGTRDTGGIAYLNLTATGSAATSTGASYTAATPQARTGIIAVFKNAAAGGGTAWTRTVSDPAGLADTATPQLTAGGTALTRTVNDGTGVTDLGSPQALDQGETVTDQTSLTDGATRTVATARTIDDPAGLADTATTTQAAARTITDPAVATDTATPQQTAAGVQQFADQTGLTDSITVALSAVRTVDDLLGLIDQAGPARDHTRTTSDTLGLADTATSSLVDVSTLTNITAAFGPPDRDWTIATPDGRDWKTSPPADRPWAVTQPTL